MDLVRWMETFIAASSSRSLSEVGRDHGLTPSAVSKQIAALEQQLNVKLISRTTRGLSLTSAGEAFLPRAVKIVEDISDAMNDVRGTSLSPRGTLTIAAPVAFGRLHIAPAIPKFLLQYPDIRVNFGLFDRQVDPAASGVDIAFRMGHLKDSSFVAAKLASTRRVLCATPAYLERNGWPSSPDDLVHHACLVHTIFAARNTWYFKRGSEVRAVPVKGRMSANNSEALFLAAQQGLGIALLGSWAITEQLKSGALVDLLPDWSGQIARDTRDVYAVYQRSQHGSQLYRIFIDFMRNHFGTPAYWDR